MALSFGLLFFLSQKGEISLSLDIIVGKVSIKASTSSSFVNLPRLILRLLWAEVIGTCIALKTWLGSNEPEVQAEPEEIQNPNLSN